MAGAVTTHAAAQHLSATVQPAACRAMMLERTAMCLTNDFSSQRFCVLRSRWHGETFWQAGGVMMKQLILWLLEYKHVDGPLQDCATQCFQSFKLQ